MALPKLYNRAYWNNNTTPAVNADNLNALSKGASDIDDRLIALAGTIMEDVPQIQEDLEILEPAIENIDSNVARAETAAEDAEESADEAEYWANVSNPPIPVTKDYASVITVDDAIPKAATDVKVKVEAVQDLHGYDKPWVGGAGKNLLKIASTTIPTTNGITVTQITDNAGNIIGVNVNGRATADCGFTIFGKGIGDSFAPLAGKTLKIYGGANCNSNIYMQCASSNGLWGADTTGNGSSAFTVESTEPSNWNAQVIVKNGTQVNNVKLYPMICLASASPTFEPYENKCPISGFTEAKVTRTGKNLFIASYTETQKYLTSTGGTSSDANFNVTDYIRVKANTSYILSGLDGANNSPSICLYDKYKNFVSGTAYLGRRSVTITTGNNGAFVRFSARTDLVSSIQFEEGTVATDYVPSNGTTYIIDLDGTRYGATIDVDSGVMTVTHGIKDLGDFSWTYRSEISSKTFSAGSFTDYKKSSNIQVISSIYDFAGVISAGADMGSKADSTVCLYLNNGSGSSIFVNDSRYNDASAFTTGVTGQKIVYELATPITVQLTPKEVQMLQGYNVLSANSGDVYLKYDASMIQRIANEKLDISTFKSVVASSSDFADFKTKVAAL